MLSRSDRIYGIKRLRRWNVTMNFGREGLATGIRKLMLPWVIEQGLAERHVVELEMYGDVGWVVVTHHVSEKDQGDIWYKGPDGELVQRQSQIIFYFDGYDAEEKPKYAPVYACFMFLPTSPPPFTQLTEDFLERFN